METASTILERAVASSNNPKIYEDDPDERLKLIIRGCSLITQLIPFPTKIGIIFNDENVLKNLILVYPLNEQIVRSILIAIIETSMTNDKFIKAITVAVKSVALMNDDSQQNTIARKKTLLLPDHASQDHSKWRSRNIETRTDNLDLPSNKGSKVCKEILAKAGAIKLLTLNLLEKLITKMKQHSPEIIPYNELMQLLKIFIYYSKKGVIIKVVLSLYRELNECIENEFDKALHEEHINQRRFNC